MCTCSRAVQLLPSAKLHRPKGVHPIHTSLLLVDSAPTIIALRAVPEAASTCVSVQGHSWGARDPSILVTGGFATAPPGTIIANAGGLDTVFLSECSGSMALSLPAPVDAHYDITLLAVRRCSHRQPYCPNSTRFRAPSCLCAC